MDTDQSSLHHPKPVDRPGILVGMPGNCPRIFRSGSFFLVAGRQELALASYKSGRGAMKRPRHRPVRRTVRIKPGRVIMLPPRIIRRLGWNLGDRLHLFVEGAHICIERVPNETEWRISRLRTRTGSAVQRDASTVSIRAPDELLILRRDRRRPDRSKREPGQDDSVSTVAPNSAESFPSREMLQARWQAIREANESLFADLATWLER